MTGFFGNLFDLNGDGELDSLERTADFMAFEDLIPEEEMDEWDVDDDDDDF